MLERFGVTSSFYVGLFVALLALTGGAVSLLYSRIKSRLSYKAIVVCILAVWAVAFFILSQAFAIWVIVLTVALFGMGLGLVLPSVPAWVGELVPPASATAALTWLGALVAGAACGLLVAAVSAARHGAGVEEE